MHTAIIETKEGLFTAHYSERGLAGLRFPSAKKSVITAAHGISSWPAKIRQWHKLATAALREALNGATPKELPPLDLSAGTNFQQSVWKQLRRIAPGKTRSYSQIATAVGRPRASRAAGSACGANPIPVLVPCHRVLAAQGGLGGFSGGLNWKRRLLQLEGITL